MKIKGNTWKVNEKVIEKVKTLVGYGLSHEAIGDALSLSISTVNRIVKADYNYEKYKAGFLPQIEESTAMPSIGNEKLDRIIALLESIDLKLTPSKIKEDRRKGTLTAYNRFFGEKVKEGLPVYEIAKQWKEFKENLRS